MDKQKQREYSKRYREKDLEAYRARNAAYAREWRARPENLERARASNKASQERAKAADPEGWKERQRERYQRYIAKPGSIEKHRAQGKAHWRAGLTRRRGLTRLDQHDYWLSRGGLCDFCGRSYPDPLEPQAWRYAVVDHDQTHCDSKIGCRMCVRAMGHRACNIAEGLIRKAVAEGLIDTYTGRLADVLRDRPLQQWLQARSTN